MAATTVLMLLVLPNGLGIATLTKAPGAFLVAAVVVAALTVPLAHTVGIRRSTINGPTYLSALRLRRRPRRGTGKVALAYARRAATYIGSANNHGSNRE
jgi:hypothetical protein